MGKLSQQARMNEAAVADLDATLNRISKMKLPQSLEERNRDRLTRELEPEFGAIKAKALAQAYYDWGNHLSEVRFRSEVARIKSCNVERMGVERG